MNILQNLYIFLEKIPITNIDYDYETTTVTKNKLHNTSKFIPNKLLPSIYKLLTKTTLYFIIYKTTYIVNINYDKHTDITAFIPHLLQILQLVNYFKPNRKFKITINYYLLNDFKKMNNKHIFSSNEVNSGYTTHNSHNRKDIVIFRKEEILKVTLHEMIHALHLDFNISDMILHELNHYYNKIYKLTVNIKLSEAYTDLWAILLHNYYICKITNNNYKYFNKLITIESKFINYQSNKILHTTKKHVDTYTSVFSYYILKNILFQHLDILLEWFLMNNKQFIILTKKKSFIKLIKSLQYNYKTYQSKQKWNQTMRMSINELSNIL